MASAAEYLEAHDVVEELLTRAKVFDFTAREYHALEVVLDWAERYADLYYE